MSDGRLIKLMSAGLHPGVDSVLESLLRGTLGPGEGGGNLGKELDEEFK